jgi:hypothetical protein
VEGGGEGRRRKVVEGRRRGEGGEEREKKEGLKRDLFEGIMTVTATVTM